MNTERDTSCCSCSNKDLDTSQRSTSSSGVGYASSFLQSQISLRKSLNDWDEEDPEVVARRRSLEEEQKYVVALANMKQRPRDISVEDMELAFRPRSEPLRRSNPDLTHNPSSAAATLGNSKSNGAGFMRSSFCFEPDEHLTMDASLRSSGGPVNLDDSCSSFHGNEEYIGMIQDSWEQFPQDIGEQDSVHSSQYSEHYSNNEDEYEQAIDFGEKLPPTIHTANSVHSSNYSGHYSNKDTPSGKGNTNQAEYSPSSIDTTCKDLEHIILKGEKLLDYANTNYTRSNSWGYLSEHCSQSSGAGAYLNENRRYQRTLSQTSIISLLKMQRIDEKNQYMDDMKGIDLEQTVKNMSESGGSVVGDLGESGRDGEDLVVEYAGVEDEDGSDLGESGRDGDDVESSPDTGNEVEAGDHQHQNTTPNHLGEPNTASKQKAPRRGSFLPQHFALPPPPLKMQNDRISQEDGSLDRGNADQISHDDENAVEVHILPLDNFEVADDHKQNSTSKQPPARRRRFLPEVCRSSTPPLQQRVEIQNPPPHQRAKSWKSSEGGADDTSSFFMQSIKSMDNVTHMSDAPDYDYNSISSEDEKNDRVDTTVVDAVTKSEEQTWHETREAEGMTQYVSPEVRRRRSLEMHKSPAFEQPSRSKQVSDEVCGLLGLPKEEGARRVHRGIMSYNTELRLRKMFSEDPDNQKQQIVQAHEQNRRQQYAQPESGKVMNDSDDSDAKERQDDKKWEEVRRRRMIRRQSSKTSENQPESSGVLSKSLDLDGKKSNGESINGSLSKSMPIKINDGPSCSSDLVYGNAQNDEKKNGADKWESIRRDRLEKRRSSRTNSFQSDTISAQQDIDSSTSARAPDSRGSTLSQYMKSPPSTKPIKSTCPIQRVDDDDQSVFSGLRGLLGRQVSSRSERHASPILKSRSFFGNADDIQESQQSGRTRRLRESESSNESYGSNALKPKSMRRTNSFLNFFSGQNASEDTQESSSRCASMIGGLRRNSSVVNVLGFKQSYSEPEHDDESQSSDDESSDDEAQTTWNSNILSEGEYYLAMSMLVYVICTAERNFNAWAHDVNSHQSELSDSSSLSIMAKTKSAGFIIRVVLDELEKKGTFSTVSDMGVLKEFKKWVHESRCQQLDLATESTIKELRKKVARERWRRAIKAVRITIRLKRSQTNISSRQKTLQSDPSLNQRTTPVKRASGLGSRNRSATLSQSMMWVHNAKEQIMSSLGVSTSDQQGSTSSLKNLDQQQNQLVGNEEIKEIIDDALERPRFFREGSLMSNLIESGIEVVWFGDRHPNDVVYSICCNRQEKRVSVVFRGTVNSHNWLMNMKFAMAEFVNPITEDYYGRSSHFGLHTGFSLYLSRQRKDDSNTKIEEIFSMINEIGRAIAPDGDYELSITGHSLGGALATLLSFYAATSSMFENLKTIRVFTFAAPRVGCIRFLYAYQHLEQIGKLRLARFSNTMDIVPLIPFAGRFPFGVGYKHVGMHVRLRGTSNWAQYWLRNALDVTYPKSQDVISQVKRGFLNSIWSNLTHPKGFIKNHTLSEYQRRIHFALEYRLALAKTAFYHDKKRNRVKTLEEYYFIRGATTVTCTKGLTSVNLEDREKEKERRKTRRIVTTLIIVALVEGVLLLKVMDLTFSCESIPRILYPFFCLLCSKKPEMADKVAFSSVTGAYPREMPEELDASIAPHLDTNKSTISLAEMHEVQANKTTTTTSDMDSQKTTTASPDVLNDDKDRLIKSVELGHIEENSASLQKGGIERKWTCLAWGVRRTHHVIPADVLQERMDSLDVGSLMEVMPFEGSPGVEETVTSMLTAFIRSAPV